MSLEQQQLEAAIAALQAQRPVLGDAVVESLLAAARAKLASLAAPSELLPDPDPEQQLKQVSILFLDVVGSTTLSQRLDPEGVSAVMDDALYLFPTLESSGDLLSGRKSLIRRQVVFPRVFVTNSP